MNTDDCLTCRWSLVCRINALLTCVRERPATAVAAVLHGQTVAERYYDQIMKTFVISLNTKATKP
jgi:hypothetical protein